LERAAKVLFNAPRIVIETCVHVAQASTISALLLAY